MVGVCKVGEWSLTEFLKVTVFAVFILPLLQGEGEDCCVAGEFALIGGP